MYLCENKVYLKKQKKESYKNIEIFYAFEMSHKLFGNFIFHEIFIHWYNLTGVVVL